MVKLSSYDAVQVSPREAAKRAFESDGIKDAGWTGWIKVTEGVIGQSPWLYKTYFYSTEPKSGSFFSTEELEEADNE